MRAIYGALAGAIGLLAVSACAQAQQNLDTFRIAIGGFGLWAAEAPRLGQQAGIFKKHGINVEYYATAGAGESLQAVISGSADLSIAVGTTGVMGAFAKGAPVRIPADFYDVYGEAMGGRKVSARVRQTAPSADFVGQPFVIRRADLDIMGHVNNAAVWQVVAEYVAPPVRYAELVHYGPVEMDHDVTVVVEEDQVWLLVDGDVRVSGSVVR